jgi:hypothetical protein
MVKVFISHDSRDSRLAQVLGETLRRITLAQIDPWFSSDESAPGGTTAGVWLDKVRDQLKNTHVLLALLTPRSVSRPWVLFESGFAAARQECEVIPVAIGLDSESVPLPLGMYKIYQIVDYGSLRLFASKLLSALQISFDEELVRPILEKSVGEFARLAPESSAEAERPFSGVDVVEEIKKHIDRALLRFASRAGGSEIDVDDEGEGEEVYSIRLHVRLNGRETTQYLTIATHTTVQDILDRTYQILSPDVKPFHYLQTWLLRERGSGLQLIIREIGSRVLAAPVFPPGSEWEVEWLTKPYAASDSADFSRWYRRQQFY